MDTVVSIIDSYGYGALVGGVAAHHLFSDFVGGKNDAMRVRWRSAERRSRGSSPTGDGIVFQRSAR
jgi:hypothetical protein